MTSKVPTHWKKMIKDVAQESDFQAKGDGYWVCVTGSTRTEFVLESEFGALYAHIQGRVEPISISSSLACLDFCLWVRAIGLAHGGVQ
ncbi:hypothetical protein NB537_15775 [Vibrio parahaemolyticus]|nr:hypothetical protein [Vibrio parahaemolyticus]MCR9656241.1 hypothetical protein [Vibrio parahaemolyticus]